MRCFGKSIEKAENSEKEWEAIKERSGRIGSIYEEALQQKKKAPGLMPDTFYSELNEFWPSPQGHVRIYRIRLMPNGGIIGFTWTCCR